jgi:hypothetical protein
MIVRSGHGGMDFDLNEADFGRHLERVKMTKGARYW